MSRVEDELSTTTKAFESLFTIMGATVFNSLLRSATRTAHNWSLKKYKTTAFLVYHYYAGLPFFDVGPSLGALNRTVLLSCDYIVTPFGCDIFSLLGIKNISEWIKNWNALYLRTLELTKERGTEKHLDRYLIIKDTKTKFRLAGYSVQQYIKRKFKAGPRPVKAYDTIMQKIPQTLSDSLSFLTSNQLVIQELELGHVPYVYSLVPLSQSGKAPIHALTKDEGLVGSQYEQVKSYAELMESLCKQLIVNAGI